MKTIYTPNSGKIALDDFSSKLITRMQTCGGILLKEARLTYTSDVVRSLIKSGVIAVDGDHLVMVEFAPTPAEFGMTLFTSAELQNWTDADLAAAIERGAGQLAGARGQALAMANMFGHDNPVVIQLERRTVALELVLYPMFDERARRAEGQSA